MYAGKPAAGGAIRRTGSYYASGHSGRPDLRGLVRLRHQRRRLDLASRPVLIEKLHREGTGSRSPSLDFGRLVVGGAPVDNQAVAGLHSARPVRAMFGRARKRATIGPPARTAGKRR